MIIFLGSDLTTKLYSDFVKKSYQHNDIVVSCQYGFKIPASLPQKYPCVNIHYGALPKYAGCNPVFWQIANGEQFAGVTLHYVDKDWDSGDIIEVGYVPIDNCNAEEVYNMLSIKGLELLEKHYDGIRSGFAPRTRQDLINRVYYKQGLVDWGRELDPEEPNFQRLYQAYNFPSKQEPKVKGLLSA